MNRRSLLTTTLAAAAGVLVTPEADAFTPSPPSEPPPPDPIGDADWWASHFEVSINGRPRETLSGFALVETPTVDVNGDRVGCGVTAIRLHTAGRWTTVNALRRIKWFPKFTDENTSVSMDRSGYKIGGVYVNWGVRLPGNFSLDQDYRPARLQCDVIGYLPGAVHAPQFHARIQRVDPFAAPAIPSTARDDIAAHPVLRRQTIGLLWGANLTPEMHAWHQHLQTLG